MYFDHVTWEPKVSLESMTLLKRCKYTVCVYHNLLANDALTKPKLLDVLEDAKE